MRWTRWISGIVWVGSWRIIYLEIVRWHHLTWTLRFNPPPMPPGSAILPKAGLPVRLLRVAALASPVVFLFATVADRSRRLRAGSHRASNAVCVRGRAT
jgi:hypothetical protein